MTLPIDWLEAIEELVVRAPGVLARLGTIPGDLGAPPVANYELAKARVAWDAEFNAAGAIDGERPFFVLREAALEWAPFDGGSELDPIGQIELYCTDFARQTSSEKASKRDFANFWGGILQYCADNQGKPIDDKPGEAFVALASIQQTVAPQRSKQGRRGVQDYWEAAALLTIGER